MSTDFTMQFTLFPLLPIELRIKIWRVALHEHDSIVELRVANNAIIPTSPLPAVFHINQESRSESITLLDGLYFPIHQPTHNRLYLLLEQDILYLSHHYYGVFTISLSDEMDPHQDINDATKTMSLLAGSLSDGDRATIQNLAIDIYEWSNLRVTVAFIEELCRFEGLNTLVVVLRSASRYYGNRMFVESASEREHKVEWEMGSILFNAEQDRPQWKAPKLRVVYLKRDEYRRGSF